MLAVAQRVMVSRRWAAAVLAVLLALAVLATYRWSQGTNPQELAALGYPGVFLMMLISGSSTILPIPGHASIIAAGVLWNPVLVGIAAGLGNATGEAVAYLAASMAISVFDGVRNSRWINLFSRWLQRYGFFAILAIALIPNFVFDFVGIAAAAAGYPLRRFWLACVLGNCVKYVVIAHLAKGAGAYFGIQP